MRPQRNRSPSPEDFRSSRTISAVGEDLSRYIKHNNEDAELLYYSNQQGAPIGHNADERIRIRSQRTNSPPVDEQLVKEILQSPSARHRSPITVPNLSGSRPNSSGQLKLLPDPLPSIGSTASSFSHIDRVPNARLGEEISISEKTSLLGSSQLGGCQGDFCHLNIYEMHSADSLKRPSNMIQQSTMNKPSTDYQKALKQAGIVEKDGSSSKHSINRRIAYRSIIQARQEMPLVRLHLDSFLRGEDAPYMLEDSYNDVAVGGKLPSHYYQDVACCENCFYVYSIVDKARAKAVKELTVDKDKKKAKVKIAAEQEEAARGKLPASKSFNESNSTNRQISQLDAVNSRKRPYGNSQTSTDVETDDELMQSALSAIDGLTKLDVAEIRTMVKPPAAVEVVMEAVMILLTGKQMPFKDTYRLLSGGEAFINMLREFNIETVTEDRLRAMEIYVDNPLFRPENVLPVSRCASKFCAWVHGVVHAARQIKGAGHKRIDTIKPKSSLSEATVSSVMSKSYLKPLKKPTAVAAPNRTNYGPRGLSSGAVSTEDDLSFIQKLEKMKATRVRDVPQNIISREDSNSNSGKLKGGSKTMKRSESMTQKQHSLTEQDAVGTEPSRIMTRSVSPNRDEGRTGSKFDPGPTPSLPTMSVSTESPLEGSQELQRNKPSKRELKAMKAMQSKSTNRLAAQSAMEGSVGVMGLPKQFRCSDGLSIMPYIVMGKFSMAVEKCSFVVIHDFFDTYDATAILFKPVVQRHEDGCQVLCFNYPGQAHTTWPRLSQAERDRGARDPVLNNEWIADRVHELLMHAEESGDILLSKPFHLVGIGNGSCIAAAFCQRYGNHPSYVNSLRSVASINGFLYPDAQLAAILHAAYQVFESTPQARPDIAVSYWSRFIFSEDYLNRINPNLALNIYTAVANPITSEGRVKITRGCLSHRDLRGALSPELPLKASTMELRFQPIQVPVIVLQSTEDTLVNASNVDSFLIGRTSKHLWSHMLNVPSESLMAKAFDPNAQWVGRMSTGPEDYAKYSTLGKAGIRMLIDSLRSPKGAFVMWARTGHNIQQEYKAAVLDLLDILACPTDEYTGLNLMDDSRAQTAAMQVMPGGRPAFGVVEEEYAPELKPPKATKSLVLHLRQQEDKASLQEQSKSASHAASVSFADEVNAESKADRPPAKDDDNDGGGAESLVTSSWATIPENFDDTINNLILKATMKGKSEGADELVESRAQSPIAEEKELPADTTSLTAATVSAVDRERVREPSPSPSPAASGTDEAPLESYWDSKEIAEYKAPSDAVPVALTDADPAPIHVATHSQQVKHEWVSQVPDAAEALALEQELRAKQREYEALEAKLKLLRSAESQIQESIRATLESKASAEDATAETAEMKKMQSLSAEIEKRQRERDFSERQRRVELADMESALVNEGILPAYEAPDAAELLPLVVAHREEEREREREEPPLHPVFTEPLQEMRPLVYEEPAPLPSVVTEGKDPVSRLDQMVKDEEEARKKGIMSMEDYEKVKAKIAERQLQREARLHSLSKQEVFELQTTCAIAIGRIIRGFNARRRCKKLDALRKLRRLQNRRSIQIQATIRGFLGRRRYKRIRAAYLLNIKGFYSATQIQRVFRGYLGRQYFAKVQRLHSAKLLQRAYRGYLGRKAANRERQRLEKLRVKNYNATKIQSIWRMKVSKEEYRSLRIHILATIEIQRVFRGYLGRKKMARRRQWETTKPGPERIKLGLQFIEESKQAFERQQEEIDSLHRAQERAEARISHIHAELKESEKELVVLERELQEIDQIERDLQVLTHERNLLSAGIEDAAGMPRIAGKGRKDLVMGGESKFENDPMADRKRRAEAYALEMTIQLKRAEREKKRQELEIEFSAVFQEVEKKRKALQRLELSLADMESTRERKDREFKRLQKNLMQLLLEQKQELDELREKGLELETATATTAAAAVATAQKAKEHEKRSHAMFSQTEELMKFQFMSMSLSYFSSLNMLKSLRDMNADTTSAAIALSADASATAAASAAAANLPNIKKLNMGADDFIEASIRKKKDELLVAEKAKKELVSISSNPLPNNVRTWSVTDVSRWLESLSLSQYVEAFREGSVDGVFLLELREEDLIQVLGIRHKLHVRKILLSREKLKPLNSRELNQMNTVLEEEKADMARQEMEVPSLDTVFSQARNGRIKRVEESLNLGFAIDAEDERGNTLLLVATQNRNKKLVEMLLLRGADINHQNATGNTALHYAIELDPDGVLSEYLIERGADDTIENIDGLTPYDGVAK